jgi:hypothetical protein
MTFHKGQPVTVSGARGTVAGRVLDVRTPDDLQPVPELPNVAMVAACMRDLGIREVAYIAHIHAGRLVAFAAVRVGRQWYDMQRRPLTITTAHQGEEEDNAT